LRGKVGLELRTRPADPDIGAQFQLHGRRYTYERIQIARYAPWRDDPEFMEIYQCVRSHTLVDIYRCYELWELVRQVQGTEGDVLEVGVWRGGTGAVLAAAARRFKRDADTVLCDTFSGVVKAGERDQAYRGGEHADTSPEIVVRLLESLSLRNCRVVTGIFPDEVAEQMPNRPVALCHIDVDVYESARSISAWVAPRLVPQGILVFDDYGFLSCPGVTQLVDEMREDQRWYFTYNLNGHAILASRT